MSEAKSEGKREGEEEEEVKASDLTLLQRAAVYCESPRFSSMVEAFEERHVHSFANDDGYGESSLEHSALFADYTSLLEGEMEGFLRDSGATQHEFYLQCQDVVEGKFTALFAEHEHQWFVDLLKSWTDFSSFRKLMVRRNQQRVAHK